MQIALLTPQITAVQLLQNLLHFFVDLAIKVIKKKRRAQRAVALIDSFN